VLDGNLLWCCGVVIITIISKGEYSGWRNERMGGVGRLIYVNTDRKEHGWRLLRMEK
jgi:hypothetical protein